MHKGQSNIRLWSVFAVMLFHYIGFANSNSEVLKTAFDHIVSTNKVKERKGMLEGGDYLLILSGSVVEDAFTYLKIDRYASRLQLIEQNRQAEFKQLSSKLEKINADLIKLGKKGRVYVLIGENHTIPVRLKDYYGIDDKNAFKHFFTKNEAKKSFFDKSKWDASVQVKTSTELVKNFASYRALAYTKLVSEITENQEDVFLTTQFNFILAKKTEYDASTIKAIGKYGYIQVRRAKGESKEIKTHVKNYLNNKQLKTSLLSLSDALGAYITNGFEPSSAAPANYCEGFEYIDELSKDDITSSTKSLEEAITKIEKDKGKVLSKGVFNHFIGNGAFSKLSKEKLQTLEDKLQLLSNQLDKHIVVQFLKLPNNSRYNDNLLKRLAAQSLKKAKNTSGKEVIYMIFSHSDYESILWENKSKTCYNFGFAQTTQIVDVHTGLLSGLSERILNVFKAIEKPLNVFGVVRLTDGSIVKLYRKSTKNIKGYALINGLVLLESPHFNTLQKIITEKPEKPDKNDYDKGLLDLNDDEYREAIRKYRKKYTEWLEAYNKVKLEGMQEDREKMASKNKGYEYFKTSDGAIRMRENYITQEAYNNDLLISYAKFHYDNLKSPWTTGLLYHISDTYQKLNATIHLLDDMSVSIYVYQTIDAASLVLAPFGLDFIPDLIGIVYATVIDGNGFQAGAYGTSLVAVGYLQYVSLANKYAYKTYKAVGVLDASGDVVSISSKLDNYVPKANEQQLSTLIAKNHEEAEAILKQDLPYYHVKFANGVDDLLKRFDDLGLSSLITKLDDIGIASKTKFLDDFAEASDDVLIAFKNDEELLGLWVKYSDEFKGSKYVTENGAFKTCQSVLDNHPDGYLGNLAKKVMDSPKPSNSEQVLVGVTHPSFEGKVFMGSNFKKSESALEATFKAEAHPIIRDRIKYMDFVRNSVTDETGKVVNEVLANKLLDIDNLNKLTTSGRAGYHGEVRALSDALYELEKTKNVTSSTLSEFDLFIRNSSNKVMQRCPCCFHITNGVKVLEGN